MSVQPAPSTSAGTGQTSEEARRTAALEAYKKALKNHEDLSTGLKKLRFGLKDLDHDFNKTEDDIRALQSVGQIIGEVLKQLDEERFIVKASSGPRYLVGCRNSVPKHKLKAGVRVSLDMTTLTIMRILPRETDPMVYSMSMEDPAGASFAGIGGLSEQIRELREVVELPLLNPELFLRVGIKPPKGVLLYGPPGTGKTLLARAVAATLDVNFLKVVSSAIVDKYIGESARLIREMFGYAKEHAPTIIFMDEIDAIGGRRFSEGTSHLCHKQTDTLDPALMRPGRIDRKIEIPLPNDAARLEILKIHAKPVAKRDELDYEAVVKLTDGCNAADLRNVITEAGMFAIRDDRSFLIQEDIVKAARKVMEAKSHESQADYSLKS
ncbi:hypothetical protein L7F22_002985 [Adiantum nelumboides]|nr:hypothetical protein [Adiantum nelumboides]